MGEIIGSPKQLGSELNQITEGVLSAGKIALDAWEKGGMNVVHKGFRQGIVTSVDLKLDKYFIEFLAQNFPSEQIMTEESFRAGEKFGNSYHVVDPIDGTNHFVRQLHEWSVVYAHIDNGQVDSAVIYAPAVGELYVARKGFGAFKNGRKMIVSARSDDEVGVQLGHDTIRYYGKIDIEERAAKVSRMLWITGSTSLALAWLANGQIEIAVNLGQPVWDFAAGMLMTQEAGGKFTDFEGNESFDFSGNKTNNCVASNGIHHNLGLQIANPALYEQRE